MDKDARRALMVAKNLLPERPIEAHPLGFILSTRAESAPADDKYRGSSDSRLKVWANRPDPITRADHILDGNTVTTPEDEVLRFPTREHAVDYIDSMVGHWPRYAKGGSVHPATQIPGVHISERIHGKPIFTGERIGKEGGGLLTGKDQTQDDEGITAYQGGPHSVGPEGYDNSKLGTGEGAHAYGYGHYFAEHEPVAQDYRDSLAHKGAIDIEHEGRARGLDLTDSDARVAVMRHADTDAGPMTAARRVQNMHAPLRSAPIEAIADLIEARRASTRGHMHQVRIQGRPEHFLDYDKPLGEQSDHVKTILGIGRDPNEFTGRLNALIQSVRERGAPTPEDKAHGNFLTRMRNLRDLSSASVSSIAPKNRQEMEAMAAAGIRGIRYLDGGSRGAGDGTRNYVVFDPKHIDIQRRYARGGMAYGDGGSTPDAGVQKALDLTRDLNPQGLYSHASEAALASPQAKGPLPQMLASLKGVKPDELKYSGVDQAFAGQPRVTREELAQHFQQGLPNIQETTLREGGNEGRAAYENYTMPGGSNYREILMHLPEGKASDKTFNKMTPLELQNFIMTEDRNAEVSGMNHEELMELARNVSGDDGPHQASEYYKSGHWPQKNVLAHLRLKDQVGPNGEKILHVEEVQSDWGQQARSDGTYNSQRPYQVFETNTGKVLSEHATREEAAAESEKHRAAGHEGVDHGHAIDSQTDKEPVPDAPYIGNTQGWTDLALKRALHEAAVGGYDKIVYTPGTAQADRYKKNQLVRQIIAHHHPEGIALDVYGYHGNTLAAPRELTPEQIASHVGEEPAKKILSQLESARSAGSVVPRADIRESDLGALRMGGEGMKGYYDKIVPKSLLTLARQHDPNAKLGEHEVVGLGKYPAELEFERQIGAAPPDKHPSLPGLDVTPRMRESIPKRGFKAYARGGEVEGYGRGGRRGSYHPDDDVVREALARSSMMGHNSGLISNPQSDSEDDNYRALMSKILDPRNPEHFEAAKRLANEVYNVDDFSYSGFKKHPVLPSQVTTTISDIPGATPKTPNTGSWHDFYRVGKGGTLFTLGGDRSNLGRLTHINGTQLAWPVDLHAGMKYMQEPNPGAVWANDKTAANALRNNILREADKGKEVFGAFAPMGTASIDSSKNMTDAMMSHIGASTLDEDAIDEFDAKMRDAQHVYESTPGPPAKKRAAQEEARERMTAWPGLRDPLACRDFAINNKNMNGQHRSGMIKMMDKKKLLDAGFPSVGATRAAITDPSLLHTPANMVGGNIVRLDPNQYDTKNLSFEHSTYNTPTGGELIMQVPFEARHDVLPEFTKEQLTNPDYVVKKGAGAGNPLLVHPYSPLPTGRASYRGNTEMRQAAQPINEEMLESIEMGQERRKKYGFSQGGEAERHGKAGGGLEGEMAGDKFASYKDPTGTPIDDWKWRDLPAVRAELGNITEIPSHVADFGRFMDETAKRAATQGLKPRDLVKSYAITLASIQRRAQDVDRIRAAGMPLEGLTGKIRPEGAMGEWLQTPAGQAYLDRAVRGEVHEPALDDMVQKLKPFGMAPKLADSLRWAAANLPGKEGLVSHLVAAGMEQASSPDEWRDFAKGLHGIDVSKAGFIASMLGRGDQPTFDARQRILQTGMTSTDAGKMISGPKMNPKARAGVDRLAARQSAMDLALPKELAPYYQHLAHHTIWDKASGEETTHQDLMDAMRHAASGGAIEKSSIHDHPLVHVMRGLGFPGLEETGKASNNNRSVVDEALRLTSQNGSPLPDAVNLARQHKPGRR